MKTTPHKTERLHSLDSLRAIMMLLGLVIHSAITYGVIDYGASWSLKDPSSTSLSNDFIVAFIHSFRMQIFFVVAGFFGAMLFYERTPRKMVQNRVKRILFPFMVFVCLLWPAIFFSFGYTNMVFAGNQFALTEMLEQLSSPIAWFPSRTFHLWFLYYLAIITGVSVLLGLVFKKLPKVSSKISAAFNWTIQKPILRVFVFAGFTAIIYFIMGTASVSTSTSFIPDFKTFIYYFFFYMVGWVLFKSKHLLGTMMKLDWISAIAGTAVFVAYFLAFTSLGYEAKVILKSVMVWLFVFGVTGLFIRYASGHSARMRYVSDSSYWVYLIHLPLTAFIPSLMVDWPIPATLKFLIVLLSTGIICFVSYHYLVRGTFIGQFLNGRKYSKKISDIRKAEELFQLKPVFEK